MTQYEIKGVKSFIGQEGYGFNASLYSDGKKIAFIINDANGGMYHCQFTSKKVENTFDEYLKTLPNIMFQGIALEMDRDLFVGQLVDSYENDKKFKRYCKTKTLFRLEGDADGEYRIINHVYDDCVKAFLEKKYANKVTQILNTKYA